MGLVASQARLLMLHARKSDLEFRMQQITQEIMSVSAATSPMAQQFAQNALVDQYKLDTANPNNAIAQAQTMVRNSNEKYTETMAPFQEHEKRLQLQLKSIEIQHRAVSTEIESVQKIIDKNIDMTFKYVS